MSYLQQSAVQISAAEAVPSDLGRAIMTDDTTGPHWLSIEPFATRIHVVARGGKNLFAGNPNLEAIRFSVKYPVDTPPSMAICAHGSWILRAPIEVMRGLIAIDRPTALSALTDNALADAYTKVEFAAAGSIDVFVTSSNAAVAPPVAVAFAIGTNSIPQVPENVDTTKIKMWFDWKAQVHTSVEVVQAAGKFVQAHNWSTAPLPAGSDTTDLERTIGYGPQGDALGGRIVYITSVGIQLSLAP